MTQKWWVKFRDTRPELYEVQNFDEFWHTIRERMLRFQLYLEWIINA